MGKAAARHPSTFLNATPAWTFFALFIIAIAVGVGQFRRVTSDEEHQIARYKRLLAPLQAWRLQKIVLTGPAGAPEALPQARLAMAPCVLADGNAAPSSSRSATDTSLVIRRKTDDWSLRGKIRLWYAEDEVNRYALLIPTHQ